MLEVTIYSWTLPIDVEKVQVAESFHNDGCIISISYKFCTKMLLRDLSHDHPIYSPTNLRPIYHDICQNLTPP